MEFTAEIIANYLKGEIEGNPNVTVYDISRIEEGKKGTLAFLANPKYEKYLYDTQASVVLVNRSLVLEKKVNPTLIRVDDAYQAFASLLNLYSSSLPQKQGIDPQTYIHESVAVGTNCYVGAFAFIGEQAIIGNNVKIYPQVYIGDKAKIGDNTTLYPGVKIYNDCHVGKNCIIHASSVVGSDGFGFAPATGTYQKIPQLGNVIIEDEVEIGSNVSIDRSTMGSTIIRKGTKIDNLIQIAHNVEVGENTIMCAQSGIAGSTKVGNNVMIGAQAGIVGHITVANDVKIGAQSGVSHSLTNEGEVLLGSPAYNIRETKKSLIIIKKLPELYAKVREIEKELEALHKNMNL
jgi:UDP-3-O-[3-hydroxymyristoyl] glucosamine N-acyltransferase